MEVNESWSNKEIWPWRTKWSRAKANRILPRKHTGHSKHPLPTTEETMYTWTSPDGQYQNQIDYILCSQRWRISIWSAKTRLGDDYGSDHELLITNFRLKLKKVQKTNRLGKTNRPFIIRSSLDDTTLMEDTEEELKSLLMRMKEESENLA